MALTPDDIEKRQFGTSRKGYSPDEVKRFLAEVAAAQRQAEATPAFARLGGEVASVLESAHRAAESTTASAQADADQTRAQADAYALQTRSRAEREAAEQFAAAEKARIDAEAAATELRDAAERQAANDRAVAERARAEAEAFAASETERITQAKKESEDQIAAAIAALETDETDRRAALDAEESSRRATLESETSVQRDEAATRAAQLVADAETQASSVLKDAQAHAEQVTSSAEAQAAALLADAQTGSQDHLVQAEDEARLRSSTIIAQAQSRLDKLLGAERDVHDRLVAASADIRVAIGRVAGRQAAEIELTTEDPTIDIDRAAPWNDDAPARPVHLEVVPSEPVVDAGSEAAEMTPEVAPAPAGDALFDLDTPEAHEPGRGPSSRAASAQGDALSRMVNEAVGNALKGLGP